MIKKIRGLRNDELIKGSFILFFLIIIYNILNYVFQISMAKMLGPEDYSILAVLMSIVYVFSIPSEAIQTVITKYSSVLSAKKRFSNLKDILIRISKKGLLFSVIIFISYSLVSVFVLSGFLNINYSLLVLTGLFIFVVFLLPVERGMLQGMKKFTTLGFNFIMESLMKVVFSVILVLFGWKVYGAIVALILGSVIAFILAAYSLKPILKSKRERKLITNAYSSNLPILIATISIVLMYSIDIIFARRFFTPIIAGQFAFVALIAKVIIFVGSAIGKAMFPISSEQHSLGNKTKGVLKKSLAMIILFSLCALILYYIVPEFIVKIISLGSNQYTAASHILFTLGLAYSLLGFSYLIILYQLSLNKMIKSSYFTLIFVLIQVIFLYLYHSDLLEYSIAILISNLLIFLYSLFLLKK